MKLLLFALSLTALAGIPPNQLLEIQRGGVQAFNVEDCGPTPSGVPEPGAAWLAGIGLVGMLSVRSLTRRCQNCGWPKKDHKKGKCPTRLADTKWNPW